MSSEPTATSGDVPIGDTTPAGGSAPSEQELREAYEAELSRITSAEMILQAAVSLLNIAGYRLAGSREWGAGSSDAVSGADSAGGPGPSAASTGDLDQVRDAIDAVRALLPVLERTRSPAELGSLRDVLSQLQMAYAREAAAGAGTRQGTSAAAGPGAERSAPGASTGQPAPPQQPPAGQSPSGQSPTDPPEPRPESPSSEPRKGPAEASGRLWVPGR